MIWGICALLGFELVALFSRVVVEVLPEPSLDLGCAHPFALVIVGDLIAVDLAEAKISRFRVCKVKPTHARSGPHREGLRNLHAGVGLDIEQTPERSLLRVIRASRVARGRPDTAILLLNKIRRTETFLKPVTPFITHSLVQAFREGFGQTICDSLRHDRVVIVVLGSEAVAKLLQADTAGYRERADVIGQCRFLRRNEVRERSARFAALSVCLLAEEVEALERLCACLVGI